MKRIAPYLLLAGLVASTAPLWAVADGTEIFSISDPRGDDHGDGALTYPLSYYGMQRGDLDLLSLSARRVDGGTEFEATFAHRVRPTARRTIDSGGTSLDDVARFGFYTMNLDIYIDTDHVAGSGGLVTLPGRHAEMDPANAWEKVICLTPRPFEAKTAVKSILLKSLRRQLNSKEKAIDREDAERIKASLPDDIETHVFFPTRIRVSGAAIRFFVPDSFLGGPARADWGYVVFTTGTDIDQRFEINVPGLDKASDERLMLLPIGPGGGTDHFGGGHDDDELQPPIVDLVVPAGASQEKILNSGDPIKHVPVRLPAVIPAGPAAAKPAPPPHP